MSCLTVANLVFALLCGFEACSMAYDQRIVIASILIVVSIFNLALFIAGVTA